MEISHLHQLVQDTPVTRVEHSNLLRLLHKILPLGHRLYFSIAKYANQKSLLEIPWGDYKLHLPSGWLDRFSMHELLFKEKQATPELILIQDILPQLEEGTILDIGAAIGLYLLHFREYSSAPIIAYEPSPLAFAICKKNIKINHLPNIDLRNKACGDKNGSISMEIGINSRIANESHTSEKTEETFGNLDDLATKVRENWTTQDVELIRLDDDISEIENVALIKIDCEGFEYSILSGAKEIIEKNRPILFVEIHPQYIKSYGYEITDICELLKPYYDLEYWDFQQGRTMNRYRRFFSYYFPQKGYKFASEQEMLKAATTDPIPTQLYLLARPKRGS